MGDFEKIYDFHNLYAAHKAARKGKRGTREVIEFEMNLSQNLTELSNRLKEKTYQISGYYSFFVYEPKKRHIHALHYIDRVVQHCLCDEFLSPLLEKRLIYDNAACRRGKGTHFALNRLIRFLRAFYRQCGTEGYFLKCDIRKFFDSIDHDILKRKLCKVIRDTDILELLELIIDSYETAPGKGLPMGNQTSQWFAIFYLDGFDRIIKEKMQIKYYSRYMDDAVMLHQDKVFLKECKKQLEQYLHEELKLEFNAKTNVFPIRNGVDYLGWHIYLTETGKVVCKVKQKTKSRYKQRLKAMKHAYQNEQIKLEAVTQIINSYHAHLAFGHTYRLRTAVLRSFALSKNREQIVVL